MANCSFDKHGLILIIFGKQHQHNFKNDLHIQLPLSLHLCNSGALFLHYNMTNETYRNEYDM